MNNLIDKYRQDELTPDELSELKKYVDGAGNDELEQQLFYVWMNDHIDASAVDEQTVGEMKEYIDTSMGRKRNNFSIWRWVQIAAAVLVPVLMIWNIYLYHENSMMLADEMVITTGKAERAAITLPDGSIVSLNAESVLKYHSKDYNRKERKIKFDGEGYFQVHHDETTPFLIEAKGLQVKVLGTVFNLLVRENNHRAELSLEEGSVLLVSTLSNKNVILTSNQKAILNQSTGDITVIYDESKGASAWRRGDLIFRNMPFADVLHIIEESYNVTIEIECKDCLADEFTGILPINNLNEVLEVLEHSYHLKAIMNGREIIMKEY